MSEGDVDVLELRRLTLSVGIASARGSEEDVAELLQGLDGQTASALLVALSRSWVNALELFLGAEGHPDPKTAVLELLRAEALEAAAE
ncbi:secretion protein HlyD [Streptomyces sp. NPDC057596]|uniref:secretion protein HlyD n=1 Tax=Streptomyces sp. NPDC057596 TaxID=3346178 RepID=UPI00368FD5E7